MSIKDPVTGIIYEDDKYLCPYPTCNHPLDKVESSSGIKGYYCPICDEVYNRKDIESW